MKIKFPWFTLYGNPKSDRLRDRTRCLGAMLVHEAVELTKGSTAAHAMPAALRYDIGTPPTKPTPALGARWRRKRVAPMRPLPALEAPPAPFPCTQDRT